MKKDIKFEPDDFLLVQDKDKIYDVKIEKKPTTFAKDALKRFTKNKASVTGAIIIGLLILLSIFVPLLSPYSTETSASEFLLRPKLFEAGTGFWDGTEKVENQIYDMETQSIVNYDSNGIVEDSTKISDVSYTNTARIGSNLGSLILHNESTNIGTFANSKSVEFSTSDNVTLNISLSDDQELKSLYGNNATYSIYLNYKYNNINRELNLVSNSTDVKEHSFNLSNQLSSLGHNYIEDAELVVEVNGDGNSNYLAIDQIKFASTDEDLNKEFENVNMTNGSKTVQAMSSTTTSDSLWNRTNLKTGVFKAEIYFADFRYDKYAVLYGTFEQLITTADIDLWVANGWIELDLKNKDSFKILDDKSPLREVTEIVEKSGGPFGKYYEITGQVSNYRLLGYEKAPKFLFGTQNNGVDLFTAVFSGLSISLLIALAASAIAFFIGIIWGSISGYYGGNLDLFMERFIEILRGIPWIVLMTLTILLLGSSIGTFIIALCITNWTSIAGRTRTQFYRYKHREYVLASRTLGAKDKRLIFKHILPNGLGTIITGSILMIPGVIFTEATLAYLGLGIQSENTLGVILSTNQSYLQTYPVLLIFPAVIISLIMISFNLFGNGLRDALNPTLKGSE